MWTAGVGVALLLSGLIGLSLGLVGGGGSIITVPVLIYVAGVPVREAVGLSLAIVGATAAVGAILMAGHGHLDLRAALLFGLTGMVGAVGGATLTDRVPPPVLLLLFALLMLLVGARMLRRRREPDPTGPSECGVWKCGLAGLIVGVLTGFLGVGGGFLIVPALLRFARMPMHRAVGTSLVIIALNSAAGFVTHLGELSGYLAPGVAFTAAAVGGVIAGTVLARRIHPAGLRTMFGGLALGVAAYLIAMNLGPLVGLIAHRG